MIKVCALSDLEPDGVLSARVEGVTVAIVRGGDGVVYAIRDECSHASVALSEGEVDGCTLECWLHGSRFDLRTGAPTGLPATVAVPVYPVEVRDGHVFMSLEPSNGVVS